MLQLPTVWFYRQIVILADEHINSVMFGSSLIIFEKNEKYPFYTG